MDIYEIVRLTSGLRFGTLYLHLGMLLWLRVIEDSFSMIKNEAEYITNSVLVEGRCFLSISRQSLLVRELVRCQDNLSGWESSFYAQCCAQTLHSKAY